MGIATDRANGNLQLSRASQDRIAALSHQRAAAAQAQGLFDAEIAPVAVPQKRSPPALVSLDEGVRPQSTQEVLAGLKPAFTATGTVTAGNASPLSDGAAAVVLVTRAYADANGLEVLAVVGTAGQIAGPDTTLPDKPAQAITAALARAGWTPGDLDFVEINEAFAAVSPHSSRSSVFRWTSSTSTAARSPSGIRSAPRGPSGPPRGARTERRGSGKAGVSLCGGGGQGEALLLYRDGISG